MNESEIYARADNKKITTDKVTLKGNKPRHDLL